MPPRTGADGRRRGGRGARKVTRLNSGHSSAHRMPSPESNLTDPRVAVATLLRSRERLLHHRVRISVVYRRDSRPLQRLIDARLPPWPRRLELLQHAVIKPGRHRLLLRAGRASRTAEGRGDLGRKLARGAGAGEILFRPFGILLVEHDRSEERRGGEECVSTGNIRWEP